MIVSATAPMTGSHDRLEVALPVLLAVFGACAALDFAGRLHSLLILNNIFCMNCWRPATARGTHRQEVAC